MNVEEWEVKKKKLDKFKIGAQIAVDEAGLMGAESEINYEYMRNEFQIMVHGHIWAERLHSETIRYPANWWQAVKERWFPAWAIARWPVQYRAHKIDVLAKFPEFKPPEGMEPVVFYVDQKHWDEE